MRVLLSLCVALLAIVSAVQCDQHTRRTRHPRPNHGLGEGHDDGQGHSHSRGNTQLSKENTDFAFRLYKHISALPDSQFKNVFFSPLSVSVALSALSLGARGKTHQQLFEGLGFNATDITAEEVSQSFESIIENLNNKTEVTVSVDNVLFINENFKPLPEFLESMKRYYHSEGFSTDFTKTEEAKEQINKYVEEKTRGRIKQMLQELDPEAVMYLISHIYFKCKWAKPFSPDYTEIDMFHVDNKTTVLVEMMSKWDNFHVYYDEDISTHVLRLYYDESVLMVLALPEKGLQNLEEVLSGDVLSKWMSSVNNTSCFVRVPKLSFETSYNFEEVLPGMGITDPFEHTANLTGISADGKLFVSKVIHKANLDVAEEGTVAFVATAAETMLESGGEFVPPNLKFDHPFLVFVIDSETMSVLFMGKIVNP